MWRNVNARHRGDLDAVRTMWHPECIFDFSRAEGWIGAGVYRGHDGIADLFTEWGEAWREGGWVDATSLEDVWLEEFEGGVFLIDTPVRGVGRVSGALVVMDRPHIIELRDGLPWRFEHFTDKVQALNEARARSSRVAST